MAFTNAHLLVRLNGGFGSSSLSPSDKWSSGFRVGIPTQDIRFDEADLQTFANSVHAAAGTLHINAATAAGTSCFFTHVTVARVGEDGKYNPGGQLTTVSAGTASAGAGATIHPWSTAMSIGLRTANPRGYASNGRFYYPATAIALVASTGRVNATAVANRLAVMRTFFNAVNTAALVYEAATGVQVMSDVNAGTTARVLALRSDDRLDNIERRENQIPPAYQTVTL